MKAKKKQTRAGGIVGIRCDLPVQDRDIIRVAAAMLGQSMAAFAASVLAAEARRVVDSAKKA